MSALVSLTWPADLPEDCPPDTALPADGTYYRVVNNDPLESGDFVSVYHLNANRGRNVQRRRITQCQSMGLSVYADITSARKCAGRYPNLGNKIARVSLTPGAGKILETSGQFPSHHTWWKYEEYNPAEHSEIVESL